MGYVWATMARRPLATAAEELPTEIRRLRELTEGMDYADVAKMMDISYQNVRDLLLYSRSKSLKLVPALNVCIAKGVSPFWLAGIDEPISAGAAPAAAQAPRTGERSANTTDLVEGVAGALRAIKEFRNEYRRDRRAIEQRLETLEAVRARAPKRAR